MPTRRSNECYGKIAIAKTKNLDAAAKQGLVSKKRWNRQVLRLPYPHSNGNGNGNVNANTKSTHSHRTTSTTTTSPAMVPPTPAPVVDPHLADAQQQQQNQWCSQIATRMASPKLADRSKLSSEDRLSQAIFLKSITTDSGSVSLQDEAS
jgi:hypothetical protein